MSRSNKALVLLAVAIMGIWGCTQGPTNGAASAERIKALEEKCAKLEEDVHTGASARDQLRKKLAAAEDERARLGQELDQQRSAAKERDEMRQQLVARTSERDAIQAQFEQFRKGIRSLLGQAEASNAAAGGQPVSASSEVPDPGKS